MRTYEEGRERRGRAGDGNTNKSLEGGDIRRLGRGYISRCPQFK